MLDAGSLQDSLLNLVLNARDAIGASPGQIAIRLSAVQDTWLDIAVTDTGPGFSETALDRALDPFFTTKGDAGSGLGLSMVYDLTKLAGGQVRLENRASGGHLSRCACRSARPRPRPGPNWCCWSRIRPTSAPMCATR